MRIFVSERLVFKRWLWRITKKIAYVSKNIFLQNKIKIVLTNYNDSKSFFFFFFFNEMLVRRVYFIRQRGWWTNQSNLIGINQNMEWTKFRVFVQSGVHWFCTRMKVVYAGTKMAYASLVQESLNRLEMGLSLKRWYVELNTRCWLCWKRLRLP